MKPSSFKQWWNGLFHNRPPEDDWIEWTIDVLGYLPVNIAIMILIIGGFMIFLWLTGRKWDREYQQMLRETGAHHDA